MNFFTSTIISIKVGLAKLIAVPLIAILTIAGFPIQPPVQPTPAPTINIDKVIEDKLAGFQPSGGGTYRLKNSIGASNTTINLASFKEPVSNLPYTMTLLNSDTGYGTLDPQSPTESEFISFTGITRNTDGSSTLTGVTRGLPRSNTSAGCTASTTLARSHSGQTIFILSDSPCFFQQYAIKQNNEAITGAWTTITPTASGGIATKGYVDGLALSGSGSTDKVSVGATAGETFTAGQYVYFKSSNARWYKMDLTTSGTEKNTLIGIAQGAGTAGVAVSGGVLIHGLDATQTGLTAGRNYFASTTASGSAGLATTSIAFGKALSTTQIYFDPTFVRTNRDRINGYAGPLTVTSGTTTIDLGNAAEFMKDYSNISITGTGAVEFSNASTSGSLVILRSLGDCTITSSRQAFYLVGIGASGGTASATGTSGFSFAGRAGGGGAGSTSGLSTNAGGENILGQPGLVAGLIASTSLTNSYASSLLKFIVGGGGGGGGTGGAGAGGAGGTGGRGGGALVLYCTGALNFTSTINANGANGAVGSGGAANGAGGGGGGGGAGSLVILYGTLTANSGTIYTIGGLGGQGGTAASGTGGTGGGGGGSNTFGITATSSTAQNGTTGAAGGNGLSAVLQNLFGF